MRSLPLSAAPSSISLHPSQREREKTEGELRGVVEEELTSRNRNTQLQINRPAVILLKHESISIKNILQVPKVKVLTLMLQLVKMELSCEFPQSDQ